MSPNTPKNTREIILLNTHSTSFAIKTTSIEPIAFVSCPQNSDSGVEAPD